MPSKWKPIEDLPSDWSRLTDGELGPLHQFWNDQRADLEQSGALKTFQDRLAREWAIETGQIEGVYDLDRGVTQTLIERGINADLIPHQAGQRAPELIAAIIRDHAEVLDGLFQFVKGERPLSKGYINELHAALLRNQDTATVVDQFGKIFETELVRGRYKQRPNNPTRPDGTLHEYCPPEHVDSEMDRLISLHAEHEALRVPVEVEAAWLHHRFAQIHPYQDGNGRVARAIASAMFIKGGWFPVVVTRDDRVRYLDSLEVADDGDLRSLVAFFVDAQKRALFQAAKVAADVQPAETVDEAIAAAARVLAGPVNTLPSIWLRSKDTADRLMDVASKRVDEIVTTLSTQIGTKRPGLSVRASKGKRQPDYELSKAYDTTIRLDIGSLDFSSIVITAQAVGYKFRGLIIIFAGFAPWETPHLMVTASEEPFQVNYVESAEAAERRFRPWLEKSLARALTLWRQSL